MSDYTLNEIKKYIERNGSISTDKLREIEWEARACHQAAEYFQNSKDTEKKELKDE